MLCSDWLRYYWARQYSPLVAKSACRICIVLSAEKDESLAFNLEQDVLSGYFFN